MKNVTKTLQLQFFKKIKELEALHPQISKKGALVACSAGLDSIVLLDLLADSWRRRGKSSPFAVCYLDHGQRGDAQNERKFVKSMALKLGLTFYSRKLPLPKNASEQEMRTERYKQFARLCGTRYILFTAHHLDDQVETYFFKMLRGAHPESISGMKKIHTIATNPGRLTIARPLLDFSKNDLRDYAKAKGLHWLEDASNASNQYTRNRIRNEVFPLLEKIQPQGLKHLKLFFSSLEDLKQPETEFSSLKKRLERIFFQYECLPTRKHWKVLESCFNKHHKNEDQSSCEVSTVQFPKKFELRLQGKKLSLRRGHRISF